MVKWLPCLVCAFSSSAWAGQPWVRQGDIDGMTVEVRSVPFSAFEEIRVSTERKDTPEHLCEVVWHKVSEPGFKQSRVLRERRNERWTYERVSPPVVGERDYTMYTRRYVDHDERLCYLQFETRNQDGPPPQPGRVRVPQIYGSWTIEPNGGGGSRVTYVLYAEPGGGVPAWMSRNAQRRGAVNWMHRTLASSR